MRSTGIFVMIIIGWMVLSSISFGYSGGTGQPNTPYQIADVNDLLQLSVMTSDYTKYFILTADIDLSGKTFTRAVIAPDTDSLTANFEGTKFTGIFDGNGHTILSLTITGSGSYYAGLFGYVDTSGKVKNLNMKNIIIQGRDYVGGLVGRSFGSITACYVTGSVSGTTYVGGLAGGFDGLLTSCYATSSVTGTNSVGGLVGRQYSGTISSCCATGSVNGGTYIGGLMGYNSGSITASYSTGSVTGTSNVGGLVGYNPSDFIKSSFWDTQTSGQNVGVGSGYSTGVVGKTTAQMKTLATFKDADWSISDLDGFDADWIMVTDGQDYPKIIYFVYRDPSGIVPLSGSGTQEYPYQVGSPADLVSLSQYGSVWNKYIILTADLDMNGFSIRPIGNSIIRFTGNFNGQDHVISNLTINLPNKDYVGLFGYVGSGGVISNLGIEDVNIVGKRFVGGLVGYNSKSTISNCHSTGLAEGGFSSFVGGLIGHSIGGTISNCYSSVSVSGAGANIGGLVGCNFTGSTIDDCSASGTVADSDPNNFGSSAGGLAGSNCRSTITNCSATGNVSSTSVSSSASINIGGLVGESVSGTLSDCYATGNVHATSTSSSVLVSGGGLVGFNSSGDVDDCYATGSVTFGCSADSGYFIGGMIGLNYESTVNRCYANGQVGSSGSVQADCSVGGFTGFNISGKVYGCFWDILSSGKTTSGGGRGLATEQMKTMSIYQNAGWANNGWIVDDGQDYPHLAWEGTEGVSVPEANAVDLIGSGTAQNPYEIWTVEDFAVWGQYASVLEQHTMLMADLDFEGIDFNPIGEYGPFTGTFDGNGHVIRNITISQPTNSYVGFCSYVGNGGVIRNLGIENVVMAGGDYVGGMAGKIETGTVSNCYSIGTVNGFSYIGGLIGTIEGGVVNNCYSNILVTAWDSSESSYVGGLIGNNNLAQISQCYSMGRVTGSDGYPIYVGGMVGNNNGDMISCYSTCTIDGSNQYIGGLTGSNCGTITLSYSTGSICGSKCIGGLSGKNAGVITTCYSTSMVNGADSYIGGLIGVNSNTIMSSYSAGLVTGTSSFTGGLAGYNSGVITACFWDIQTSGKPTSAGGTGKTTVEMNTLQTFTDSGWDFTDSDGDLADWLMLGYPHLIGETETMVVIPDVAGQTQEQAQAILMELNLSYKFSYASSDTVPAGQVINQMPLTGTEIPAGFSVNLILSCGPKYSGSGTMMDPYRITNKNELLVFANTPSDYDKTFILTSDIDLSGLMFTQALIAPDTSPDAVFQGTQFTGLFDGTGHILSNLTIIAATQNYVGLFGYLGQGGMIKNLGLESVNVTGWNYVGGLAGYNNAGTISHCRTSGTISGVLYSGGLTGANSGLVDCCYSMINVRCSLKSKYIGGLVGNNSGTITSSYSSGSASGIESVGGLAGYLAGSTSKIEKCYSTVKVTGDYGVGGLLGSKQLSGSVVTSCFWDKETSGQTNSAGGSGKTIAQMKIMSTFTSATWDFTTIWTICDGTNYPRLQWQIPAGDFVCPDGVGVEDLSALSSCWMETVQAKSDIDNNNAVDFGDVLRLSQNWLLTDCAGCNGADITDDGNVNELDLAVMTEQWLIIENIGCRMMDLNDDGEVDLVDWAVFAGNWME